MSIPEIKAYHREVERYLAAVEVFRREGREPHWASEACTPPMSPLTKPREIPQGL